MKSTVAKGVAMIVMLALAQLGVGNRFAEKQPHYLRDRIDRLRERQVETLYLGDSILQSTASADTDRRSIAGMLSAERPDLRIGLVMQNALHLMLMQDLVNYALRKRDKPSRIILPVNLRSFSPMWNRFPPFQFQSERARLKFGDVLYYGYRKPMTAFGLYRPNPISMEEFGRIAIIWKGEPIATLGQLSGNPPGRTKKERLLGSFVGNYMQPVGPDHRMLEALAAIGRRCRTEGVELIVYVTPVDVEAGTQLLGKEFREGLEQRVAQVKERCRLHADVFLDLSVELDSAFFDWRQGGAPNGHLAQAGRARVAEQLAKAIPGE